MADPKKPNELASHEPAGDEDKDLMRRFMRNMREASEAPLKVSQSTRARWEVEAFHTALNEVSRRNDFYRDPWGKVDAELAAAAAAARAAKVNMPETRSGIAVAGAAGVRLLAGFKTKLEDLIKGWVPAGNESGSDLGGMSLAGARGHVGAGQRGSGDTTAGVPQLGGPILKASWAPELRWLNLDWADTAQTALLKESGAVDAYVDQDGQRRQVSATFRPTRDGSVDIQHVALQISQEDAAALAGAEVEVAWLSDEEGMAHRLVIVFRTNGSLENKG